MTLTKHQKDMLPITQAQVDECFAGTNFGAGSDPWKLIKEGTLKVCCGYWNGHTLTQILNRLGLIKLKEGAGDTRIIVTPRGRYWCYEWFKLGSPG